MRQALLLVAVAMCAWAQTTITTINPTDVIRDSRGVINGNFASLNANKVEGAALSTAEAPICFSGTGGKTAKACLGSLIPSYIVTDLPSVPTNTLAWATDATSVTVLGAGGGSTRVLVRWDGAAWAIFTPGVTAADGVYNAAYYRFTTTPAVPGSPTDGDLWFSGSAMRFRASSNTSNLLHTGATAATSAGVGAIPYAASTISGMGLSSAFIYDITSAGPKIVVPRVNVAPQASDPGTLGDGDQWYNSTLGKFRCREGGVSVNCIGSGSGTLAWELDGVSVGTEAIVNLITGTGIVTTLGTGGGKVTIQNDLDTTVGLTRAQNQTGGDIFCKPASASASTYTCALDTPLTAEPEGMTILFTPDVNNAAGAVTVNIDSRGAMAIKQHDGSTDPGAAALVAGRPYPLAYDGEVFRMQPADGGGSTTFTALTDTPANYTGQALRVPRVNAGETALEFVAPGGKTIAQWRDNTKFTFIEEFSNHSGISNLYMQTGTLGAASGEAGHAGVWSITSLAASYGRLYTRLRHLQPSADSSIYPMLYVCTIKTAAVISDYNTGCMVSNGSGLGDYNGNRTLGLVYSNARGANWYLVHRTVVADAFAVDTGVAVVANTWYTLSFIINADGSTIPWFVKPDGSAATTGTQTGTALDMSTPDMMLGVFNGASAGTVITLVDRLVMTNEHIQ